MELQEGIKYYNRMSAAFDLLKALQEGSEEKNYYLSSLSHKDLLLPDGNIGSLVEFSILMQRYVAALYLIENDSIYATDDEIRNALESSIACYTGYESEERLASVANGDNSYSRLYQEYHNNNVALDALKERYLGVKRVRE
jgi:hypothetical protein